MYVTDLNQTAELTIWPMAPARTARSQSYQTLSEALNAVGVALAADDVQAWIITEAGDILPPRWIASHLAEMQALSTKRRAVHNIGL